MIQDEALVWHGDQRLSYEGVAARPDFAETPLAEGVGLTIERFHVLNRGRPRDTPPEEGDR